MHLLREMQVPPSYVAREGEEPSFAVVAVGAVVGGRRSTVGVQVYRGRFADEVVTMVDGEG